MRSVLNPINIIPTIVRQPIPVLLEADIINSPLTIYFPARSPLRSARTHTHFVVPALNCLFSTLAPLLDTFTPLDTTSLVLNSTGG